jgi:hypothetical protein
MAKGTRAAGYLLIPILLLAFALRLVPWEQNRFLEDEALYAYWGLQIAHGADPLLGQEPVDKPPLHPYTLALSFLLFGPSEAAARLPSLLASVAAIALTYALARELAAPAPAGKRWRAVQVGLLAALLVAFSPFDILFASTAFTDPLLTALVLGALLVSAKGRLGPAGVLAGLAIATKQHGLLYLPLVVALGVLANRRRLRLRQMGPNPAPPGLATQPRADRLVRAVAAQPWIHFLLGFALVFVGLVAWELARPQEPGFWEQGLLSYGGLGLAPAAELGDRLADWVGLVASLWVSPLANALLALILGLWFVGSWFSPRLSRPGSPHTAILAFVIVYLGLHWALGFQVWDRYLLGLVPLLAILCAQATAMLARAMPSALWRAGLVPALTVLLLLGLGQPVLASTNSQIPVGGDHGAYDGIADLADFLQEQAPAGSVLYHHWLGYHYRFYLYGAPLRQHWYPDPDDLAHDATVYRREPRYIAFPSWQDSAPARTALHSAGIQLVPVFQTMRRDGTVSFRLYRLQGP